MNFKTKTKNSCFFLMVFTNLLSVNFYQSKVILRNLRKYISSGLFLDILYKDGKKNPPKITL